MDLSLCPSNLSTSLLAFKNRCCYLSGMLRDKVRNLASDKVGVEGLPTIS